MPARRRPSSADPGGLRRCLGPLAVTAQAVGTVGLTLTAVINIPQVNAQAGHSTALCYGAAFLVILLVCETMVLFQRHPAGAEGIAGYVRHALGQPLGSLSVWLLLLGYASTLLGCLVFLGWYLQQLLQNLGLPLAPALAVAIGGLLALEMSRRDVRLSTVTMLCTETVSVLIVLGICALVLQRGGPQADLQALNPALDSAQQLQAGLMAAVLSFIGFESAANLGAESEDPERAVPRALRLSVLLAGALFLGWAVVLSEGLRWLPTPLRLGVDPISRLADQLGWPGAGAVIVLGAVLCLFGTCIGALTALARVSYALAEVRLLPAAFTRLHPRYRTPSMALWGLGLPAVLAASGTVAAGLTPAALYNSFGSFAVLGFLLVYGLVAAAALRGPLPQVGRRRRLLVGSAALIALVALTGTFLAGVVAEQRGVLLLFLALLTLGVALVLWPFRRGRPAAPDR